MHRPPRPWRPLAACAAALALLALAHLPAALPAALAATDVNHASEAELDGIRGLGPGLSARILAERARGPFTGWADLIARVKGIGPASAARLSREGLTVQGQGYARGHESPAASGARGAATSP